MIAHRLLQMCLVIIRQLANRLEAGPNKAEFVQTTVRPREFSAVKAKSGETARLSI